MKNTILTLMILTLAAACSSGKTGPEINPEKVSNDAFKKEKPVSFANNADFYSVNNLQVENPGLQDETIDRLSSEEVAKIDSKGDELLTLAIVCSQKQEKESSKMISALYQKYQNFPSYWTLVANCYLQQNELRKALLYYNKALEITSSYAPALNNIGVLYYKQGQVQKALVAFERANQTSRFSKTPRLNLAKIYLSYGLADQAQPLLSGLLNQSPNDADIIVALGNVHFVRGQYAESLKYFFRLDQKTWVAPEIGMNISYALLKLGKKKDSVNVFKKIDKPKYSPLRDQYEELNNLIGD